MTVGRIWITIQHKLASNVITANRRSAYRVAPRQTVLPLGNARERHSF
jgi:hypothetical protein